MLTIVVLMGLLIVPGIGHPQNRPAQGGAATHTVTAADVEQWKTDLSNWGRWGKMIRSGR